MPRPGSLTGLRPLKRPDQPNSRCRNCLGRWQHTGRTLRFATARDRSGARNRCLATATCGPHGWRVMVSHLNTIRCDDDSTITKIKGSANHVLILEARPQKWPRKVLLQWGGPPHAQDPQGRWQCCHRGRPQLTCIHGSLAFALGEFA